MDPDNVVVPVKLSTAGRIYVDARLVAPLVAHNTEQDVGYITEQDVASGAYDFNAVTDAVEGIARALQDTIERIKPDQATVEFGVEIGVESGKLTALLVKGSGKANLKVSLQWGK